MWICPDLNRDPPACRMQPALLGHKTDSPESRSTERHRDGPCPPWGNRAGTEELTGPVYPQRAWGDIIPSFPVQPTTTVVPPSTPDSTGAQMARRSGRAAVSLISLHRSRRRRPPRPRIQRSRRRRRAPRRLIRAARRHTRAVPRRPRRPRRISTTTHRVHDLLDVAPGGEHNDGDPAAYHDPDDSPTL